jgi:hypothetical protein
MQSVKLVAGRTHGEEGSAGYADLLLLDVVLCPKLWLGIKDSEEER